MRVAAGRAAIAIPSAPSAGQLQPLPQDHKITELDSGVRIVTAAMPSVRSVALGYWIGTGSRGESEEQAGLSHLLEHLLFKGSERYGSTEIDEIFDGMGAELNAGTGKETTSVYARVIDDHLEKAVDVMSDMVFRPTLTDIDSERAVILEEIAMYEDDPQDKVFDVLGTAVFGENPLGRAIIGRAQVVAETPVDQIAAFHSDRYRPENVVIAAAGSVDHDALVEMLRTRLPQEARAGDDASQVTPSTDPRVCFEVKDTEQYHVCLGTLGLARDDDRRFGLRLLDTVLGGSSSSRLFQEVREKRGLAYSVYSFSSHYAGTGQAGVYVGTRADNLAEAFSVVGTELERIREEPVGADELARARENLKGRMLLSLESTSARMNRLGASLITQVPILSVEEAVEKIDAVTADEIEALAAEIYAPARLSAAGIGPDEDAFRAAVPEVGVAAVAGSA
ncbi:MAG: M16 family metallopeptidase [Solirubrobacteraceae bacterium]